MRKAVFAGTAILLLGFTGSALAQTASSTKPFSWVVSGIWGASPSGTSTPVVSSKPSAAMLAAPQEVGVVNYNKQTNTILITWIKVHGAEGYKIVRAAGSAGSIEGYSHSNDWTDSLPWGNSSPTLFTYTITPLDEGGNSGSHSATVSYLAPVTLSI